MIDLAGRIEETAASGRLNGVEIIVESLKTEMETVAGELSAFTFSDVVQQTESRQP